MRITSLTAPWWPSGSRWTACCGRRPVCTLGCHGHGWYWLSAGFGCPTPLQRKAQQDRNFLEWNWWGLFLKNKDTEVTDDDGAVCRSTVQLVSAKKKQRFALIRKLNNAMLHIVTVVNVHLCSSYPWIHNANTMPSWPSRVFWHL